MKKLKKMWHWMRKDGQGLRAFIRGLDPVTFADSCPRPSPKVMRIRRGQP